LNAERWRRLAAAVSAAAGLALPAGAASFSSKTAGTTAASFLELPAGARSAALGSAQAGASGTAESVHLNPAGLAGLAGLHASFSHVLYLADVSYQHVAVARRAGKRAVVGAGLQHVSYGAIDSVDNTGRPTGAALTPRDLAVVLAGAARVRGLDAGIGLKFVSSRIEDSASAAAADVGLRKAFGDWEVLASASNLGAGLRYRDVASPLPAVVRAGAGYRRNVSDMDEVGAAVDAVAPRGAAPFGAGGVEYRRRLREDLSVAARAGYSSRLSSSGLGGSVGFSAGLGFGFSGWEVDYAWRPYGDLDMAHWITLGIRFGAADTAGRPAARADDGGSRRPARGARRAPPDAPADPDALYESGMFFMRSGQYEKAVEQFDRVLSVAPKDEAAGYQRRLALEAIARRDKDRGGPRRSKPRR
jgi:hypothetical protein